MAPATCIATRVERRRPLIVDTMIPNPIFTSTHAVTIDAPPEAVWPWIAQMGAGRAGWYSWDLIDNGGRPSATRVMPDLQALVPGAIMPAVPHATDAFVVASVDPPRDLVLAVPDGNGANAVAWEHWLERIDGGRTRLIVRGRASAHWLDLARAPTPAGHHRVFIERALRGPREDSAAAADRVRGRGPPHHGGAPPAGNSTAQYAEHQSWRATRTMA